MSAIRMTFLVCDGCGEFFVGDHHPGNLVAQRQRARRTGWQTAPRHRSDLCPVCVTDGPENDPVPAASVWRS